MKDIVVLFSDIDGTLTNGRLYYGEVAGNAAELISFHVRDGMGIVQWRKLGFRFGVLSGRKSEGMQLRLNDLKIADVGLQIDDKKTWLENWLKQNNYSWSQLAFIGDDINDVEVMKLCKHSAAPADAVAQSKQVAKYICQKNGGEGAVREYIDFLLQCKL